jgi:hypothetical protein
MSGRLKNPTQGTKKVKARVVFFPRGKISTLYALTIFIPCMCLQTSTARERAVLPPKIHFLKGTRKMKPHATKNKMMKLLRAKGYNIPNIRDSQFEKHKIAFWLRWRDEQNEIHTAYYSTVAGRLVLGVDNKFERLSLAEATEQGMIK